MQKYVNNVGVIKKSEGIYTKSPPCIFFAWKLKDVEIGFCIFMQFQ